MPSVVLALLWAPVAASGVPVEVVKEWKAGFDHFKGLEFEAVRRFQHFPPPGLSIKGRDTKLHQTVVSKADGKRKIIISRYGQNLDFRFVWTERGYLDINEQPDGSYTVANLMGPHQAPDDGYLGLPTVPYSLQMMPLARFAESGEFDYLGRSTLSGSGHVRFRFRAMRDVADRKILDGGIYELVVDPDKRWALVEFSVVGTRANMPTHLEEQITYDGADEEGWPMPRRFSMKSHERGELVSQYDYEIHYLGPSRREDAEFTPEHYGLPSGLFDQVAGPLPQPWYRTYGPWGLVGRGCLVGAVLLWRRGDGETAPARGFTLIELLVVIAVVGILVALALPAVQAAWAAMRRSACGAKLAQIGLAMQGYAEVNGTFPIGSLPAYGPDGSDPQSAYPCDALGYDKGPLLGILPFLEQDSLYDSIDFSHPVSLPENSTAFGTLPAAYVCPADGKASVRKLPPEPFGYPTPAIDYDVGYGSYSASFGSLVVPSLPALLGEDCPGGGPSGGRPDGAFVTMRGVAPSEISDGLSHTMMVGERSSTAVLRWTTPSRELDGRYWNWWTIGGLRYSLLHAMQPPNYAKRPNGGYESMAAATSEHAGGLNALFCDGSVSFVADSVDSWPLDEAGEPLGSSRNGPEWTRLPEPGVWQAMATRAGSDVADR